MKQAYPNLLPKLSDDEFKKLKDDIMKRGVQIAVELDGDTGEILDGYNRAKICEELKLEYPTVKRSFANEAERRWHAVSLNILGRKSLNQSARAALAVLHQLPAEKIAAKARQGHKQTSGSKEPKVSGSAAALAKKAGVGTSMIKRAALVEIASPETLKEVAAGKKTLGTAMRDLGILPPSASKVRLVKWGLQDALKRLERAVQFELNGYNKYGRGRADYVAIGEWLVKRGEQWNTVRDGGVSCGFIDRGDEQEKKLTLAK